MSTRPRMKDFPFNAKRDPKTDCYCAICQKDIRPGTSPRFVHLVKGGFKVLHPDDEKLYAPDAGDLGGFPIGPDCARKLGLEWSRP